MTVSKVLSEAVVHLDLRSGDLAGAIAEVAVVLTDAGEVADLATVVGELAARGCAQRVTGDHEVAIIHAVTPLVERLCVALGRSPAGIVVEGPGSSVVHFIGLLLIPPSKRHTGFRLLNGLAVLLRDPMVRTQLLWAETPEEALAICRAVEGRGWAALAAWLKDRVVWALRPEAATRTLSGESPLGAPEGTRGPTSPG